MTRKTFLMILDGWGHGSNPEASALEKANTPFIDSLYKTYPNAELLTHGLNVGLPEGQMGNSEVGHLNIGAGRVVYQELARINTAIADGSIEENQTIKNTIAKAKEKNKPVHLLGLLSDGGVHSHINHLIGLCKIFTRNKVQVFIHTFLDGRDTDPNGGASYVRELLDNIDKEYCHLSSIIGRYYAMDRDKRWERIKKAYDLICYGKGEVTNDPVKSIQSYYDKGVTDEFMETIKVGASDVGNITENDIVFFTNFRTDRPRQLTEVLTQNDFPDFDMKKLNLYFVTMTEYDSAFENIHPVFTKSNLSNTLGEVLEKNNISQLRIAETEKYPHVTFFFSGGREAAFEKESRILINSPKVATYDLQPEMSAYELTKAVQESIENTLPECIILNYANADMVGHTGSFSAAVKAAEALDECLESIIPVATNHDYVVIIIADHGNSDVMINEDGSPNTAHTTNPVPIIIIDPKNEIKAVKSGILANVAPTMLKIMNIEQPKEMTASALI